MKVIIMGCGRVGTQLARIMSEENHEIIVIDSNIDALNRLDSGFKGQKIKGVGFDKDILLKAGIQMADAFAATSPSDNANIVAARIARNIFGVPRVVARIFDPKRAEIYRRLGLLTISPTIWGAERIRELILHSELDPRLSFGSGDVSIFSIEVPMHLINRQVRDLSVPGEVNVIAITRKSRAFLPASGTEFQKGDIIHLVASAEAMERTKTLLGMSEGGL
ncbi:MAG: TrkA family potassium uptake protein [Anaerolineales bacterium]|nr:TrkA family potassium uptake protein [Anaerolineales bacterium]